MASEDDEDRSWGARGTLIGRGNKDQGLNAWPEKRCHVQRRVAFLGGERLAKDQQIGGALPAEVVVREVRGDAYAKARLLQDLGARIKQQLVVPVDDDLWRHKQADPEEK